MVECMENLNKILSLKKHPKFFNDFDKNKDLN